MFFISFTENYLIKLILSLLEDASFRMGFTLEQNNFMSKFFPERGVLFEKGDKETENIRSVYHDHLEVRAQVAQYVKHWPTDLAVPS